MRPAGHPRTESRRLLCSAQHRYVKAVISVLLVSGVILLYTWQLAQPRASTQQQQRQQPGLQHIIGSFLRNGVLLDKLAAYKYATKSSAPTPGPLQQRVPGGCINNCSGVGNCLVDIGVCQCPGAWRGRDCSVFTPRPCTRSFSPPGSPGPASHVDAAGRDLNLSLPGWTHSRCAGVCDLEYGRCYCSPVGDYGRVNPPPGAPPGTPPLQVGRPMSHPCHAPRADADGSPIPWGSPEVTWEDLFGPAGWCIAPAGNSGRCGCSFDGMDGPGCSIRTEMVCMNQCSRRGTCERGFCRCQPGWYGVDCAHPSSPEAASQPPAHPGADDWLAHVSVDAWACYSNRTGCLEDAAMAVYNRHRLFANTSSTGGASSSSSITSSSSVDLGSTEGLLLSTSQRSVLAAPEAGAQLQDTAATPTAAARAAEAAAPSATAAASAATTTTATAAAAPATLPQVPPAQQPAAPPSQPRPRPLIYIYNGPEDVSSHVLQYREEKFACTWRTWVAEGGRNATRLHSETYASEFLLPELLMGSKHRTLDPQEADYFLVPVLPACYVTHVAASHDHPWFYRPTHVRVKGAVGMYWHALNWIRTQYPYWNASRGVDHIWVFPHDEGACWAPEEVYQNSIMLSHWGRNTSDNFPSHTQYKPDNYTLEDPAYSTHDDLLPMHFTRLVGRHRCYTPGKDLVLPVIKTPAHYMHSPYLRGYQVPRDILGFHRGRMGLKFGTTFSLGVRQTMAMAAETGEWARRHNIHLGGKGSVQGPYSELLARSVFCFVLQGEGWTARFDDAILHGCIPTVVIEETVGPWGSELDWEAFSITIHPKDIPRIPQILKAVPEDVILAKQAALSKIWFRSAWLTHPLIAKELAGVLDWEPPKMQHHRHQSGASMAPPPPPPPPPAAPVPRITREQLQQDAFHTLLQVLHSWLPRRGSRAARLAAAAAAAQQGPAPHSLGQQTSSNLTAAAAAPISESSSPSAAAAERPVITALRT